MTESIVAQNVRRLCEARGTRHSFIAKQAGYNTQQLSNKLTGRSPINDKDILKLSKALGVTPNELLTQGAGK